MKPHITQEKRPDIADILERTCGTLAIVTHITRSHMMQVQVIHSPTKNFSGHDTLWVPMDMMGITWKHIA